MLVTAGLVAATAPTSAYHLGLDTVHREEVDRPGAWGASVALAEPGTLEFVLNGYGEQLSTPVSHGLALYEGDGDYVGTIAVTAHHSPNRLHVNVSPTGVLTADAAEDEGWTVSTDGEIGARGGLDLVLETGQEAHHQAEGEDEPTIRSFTALHGRQAGTYKVVTWLGEAERTELEVQTDADVDGVETRPGRSHVAGDLDMERAVVDVQAQESFVAGSIPLEGTQVLGAKAMYEASVQAEVDEALRGFWGVHEQKGACTPEGCVGPSRVSQACVDAGLPPCGLTSVSWSSEADGASGEELYAFTGASPGTYTFTVDRKLDAYEADVGLAEFEQSHSYLTVADASLPSS